MKRNITIALDESTARWVRIHAAEMDTSVSEFLASLLRERMAAEQTYDRAMHEYLAVPPAILKKAGKYPTREEVNERRRLR